MAAAAAKNLHQKVIRGNLTELAKCSKLSQEMLHKCRERGIITESDRSDTEIRRIEQYNFNMNSYFYLELLWRSDERKYKLYYELATEEDTLQSDTVLTILKQGLNGEDSLIGKLDNNTGTAGGGNYSSENSSTKHSLQKIYEMPARGGRYAYLIEMDQFVNDGDKIGARREFRELGEVLNGLDFKISGAGLISREQVVSELRSFKSDCENDGHACVIIIMGHGNSDFIYTLNGEKLLLSDILTEFNNDNFKFHGRPKMFFIQVCRGCKLDRGVVYTDDPSYVWETAVTNPTRTDMLVAFSTWEGYASYPDNGGMWFMGILADKLHQNSGKRVDIRKILDQVADRIKVVQDPQREKQIFRYTNIGFTKEFHF